MASTSDCPSGAVISRDDETTVYPVVPAPPPPCVRAAPLPPIQPIEPPVVAAPMVAPLPLAMPPVMPAAVAYGARRAHPAYVTVGRVVFAGVVLLLFGAVEALGGALGAVFAASLRKAFDQALRSIDVRIEQTALPTVVAGAFLVYQAIDVRVVRLPTVLAGLGILVPYAISVLALIMAGDHFRARRLRR